MRTRLTPEERDARIAARKAATWGGETRLKYNPDVEGYGSPEQWQRIFNQTMGLDEARKACGSDSPRSILEVAMSATWDEIKRAYRKLAMKFHPDLNPAVDPAKFRKIQGAYEILEAEFAR